jgi:hypothetical protein
MLKSLKNHFDNWKWTYLAIGVIAAIAVAVCIFFPPALPAIAGFSLFGLHVFGFLGGLGTIAASFAFGGIVAACCGFSMALTQGFKALMRKLFDKEPDNGHLYDVADESQQRANPFDGLGPQSQFNPSFDPRAAQHFPPPISAFDRNAQTGHRPTHTPAPTTGAPNPFH